MSVNSKMTAIADAIRAKTGGTGLLTLDDMAQDIAAIDTSEDLDEVLDEQESIIDQIQAALEGKAAASVELGWFSVSLIAIASGEYYKLPLSIGMTWGEWLVSPYNMVVNIPYEGYAYRQSPMTASEGYVSSWNPIGFEVYITTDGTEAGRVKLTDTILAETLYTVVRITSGGGDLPTEPA